MVCEWTHLVYTIDHGILTSRVVVLFGPDGVSGWSSKWSSREDLLQQGNLKGLIKAADQYYVGYITSEKKKTLNIFVEATNKLFFFNLECKSLVYKIT